MREELARLSTRITALSQHPSLEHRGTLGHCSGSPRTAAGAPEQRSERSSDRSGRSQRSQRSQRGGHSSHDEKEMSGRRDRHGEKEMVHLSVRRGGSQVNQPPSPPAGPAGDEIGATVSRLRQLLAAQGIDLPEMTSPELMRKAAEIGAGDDAMTQSSSVGAATTVATATIQNASVLTANADSSMAYASTPASSGISNPDFGMSSNAGAAGAAAVSGSTFAVHFAGSVCFFGLAQFL